MRCLPPVCVCVCVCVYVCVCVVRTSHESPDPAVQNSGFWVQNPQIFALINNGIFIMNLKEGRFWASSPARTAAGSIIHRDTRCGQTLGVPIEFLVRTVTICRVIKHCKVAPVFGFTKNECYGDGSKVRLNERKPTLVPLMLV